MTPAEYQPLFVYYGGKARVAADVWAALGDVDNYIEAFFGTGAVLFLRPHEPKIETINDADSFVENFWRAVKHAPDEVAEHADWPVNEAALHSRHLWLLGQRERITERVMGDETFYDAKVAGYWVWGINIWIGSGWCSGDGPWVSEDGVLAKRTGEAGVNRQLPHLGDAGKGIHRTRPHLSSAGVGIHRKLPHLGGGKGIHRQLPRLGNAGQGIRRKRSHLGDAGNGACAERRDALIASFKRYSDRLRDVRVCCGDWSRVCGPSVTVAHGLTGVFLDPPYSTEANRDMGCYVVDSGTVAHEVRDWAIANGDNPLMRIALCGYEGEHAMPDSWRCHQWKAHGGYGSQGNGHGRENKHKERIWFSPNCLNPQPGLFA